MRLAGNSVRATILIGVGAAAVIAAAPAGAATQVGETGTPDASCDGVDNIVQSSTDPAGTHTVPSDGVLTSWSFRSGGSDQMARLIVWRPTAAPDQFIVVGKSDTQLFSGASVQTFPTRIPVRAGDLLGMRMAATGGCLQSGQPPGNTIRFVGTPGSDVPDGSTQTLPSQLDTFKILVAASLEPDADGDGFGDETQDQCPGHAAAQQPPCDPPVTPDTTPPDTAIASGPEGKTKSKSASFAFSGTDTRVVASFQCKLDDGPFESCTSPKTYSGLKKGSHTFSVRAVDAAGNVDPTPATRTWKVKKKKKKKKK